MLFMHKYQSYVPSNLRTSGKFITEFPFSSLQNSINRNQCVKLWFPLGIIAIFRPIKYWGGGLMMGICYITDYQNANPSRNTQRLHIIHHDSFSMFWLSSFQSFIDKNSWLNKTFCIWFCTFTHVLITITNRLHFQCTL